MNPAWTPVIMFSIPLVVAVIWKGIIPLIASIFNGFRLESRQERRTRKAELMRARRERDEAEYQALVAGMYESFDDMEGRIERWEKERNDPPAIKDPRIKKEHANWQAKFDEYDEPRRKAEMLRREQERRDAEIAKARAALEKLRADGPVLFESGAKATFYEHGRQLFQLGAKLIRWELDDIETNALDYFLQSERRSDALRMNWNGDRF